jgi:hypothetical protein
MLDIVVIGLQLLLILIDGIQLSLVLHFIQYVLIVGLWLVKHDGFGPRHPFNRCDVCGITIRNLLIDNYVKTCIAKVLNLRLRITIFAW